MQELTYIYIIQYITKISSISTSSQQSPIQDKVKVDLKEFRFISSLSSFFRPFHMTTIKVRHNSINQDLQIHNTILSNYMTLSFIS